MITDLKRFNYILKDECGNTTVVCSKYMFNRYDIEEFVDEAIQHYCADIKSIEDYLIENHEFERFKVELTYEVW